MATATFAATTKMDNLHLLKRWRIQVLPRSCTAANCAAEPSTAPPQPPMAMGAPGVMGLRGLGPWRACELLSSKRLILKAIEAVEVEGTYQTVWHCLTSLGCLQANPEEYPSLQGCLRKFSQEKVWLA